MSDKPVPTELVVLPAAEVSALVCRAVEQALKVHEAAPLLLDKQTLARKLGCSAAHIDNLRKRGLPVVHVGEAIRFDPQAVLDWLRQSHPHESGERS